MEMPKLFLSIISYGLPKSMSNIAALAPSTKICLPSLKVWCKNETVSITKGLISSAKLLYLSNSFSLFTSSDLNLAMWQSARLENLVVKSTVLLLKDKSRL